MKPREYFLECWQGKTFRKTFIFKDKNGNFTDFTGYSARMQIRPNFDDDEIAELTTENDGITLTDKGRVILYISDTDTADFDGATYKYDIELIASNGDVICPVFGKFKVYREVTK